MMRAEKLRGKPLFYIAERPGEDLLAGLRPGAVLRGRVVRILPPDKAIVRIRGLNLVAENHSGLKKGDRFRAGVKKMGLPLALTLLEENPPDEISSRLKEIGIQPTPLNRALAQALLANDFPLNREEMESFLSLWKSVSSGLGEDSVRIKTVILFKKLQAAPSPEMLEALKGEKLLMGKKIDEAIRFFPQLGEALSHLPVLPGDPQFPARVQKLPQEEDDVIRKALPLLQVSPAKVTPQLKDFIRDVGYIRDLQFLSDSSKVMTYRQIPIQEGDRVQTLQLKIEGKGRSVWLRLLGEIRKGGRVELVVHLDGQRVLLKVWAEKERAGSLFEGKLRELEEKIKGLGLKLATPLIWQQKISLSPLSFLISSGEGAVDLKG